MKRDIGAVTFMLIIAGFGLACAFGDAERPAIRVRSDYLGITGFPRIVGLSLAAIAIGCAVHSFLRGNGVRAEERLTPKSWALIATSAAYILGVCYLGFVISTLACLIVVTGLFSEFSRDKMRGIIVYSVAVTTLAFIFFKLFKVYLPDTILF